MKRRAAMFLAALLDADAKMSLHALGKFAKALVDLHSLLLGCERPSSRTEAFLFSTFCAFVALERAFIFVHILYPPS